MKNKRQYRDSAMFTMIGYIGIILVIFATLVGVGEYTGFNEEVREGLQDDPRPLTPLYNYMHPDTWEKDSLEADSIDAYMKNWYEVVDTNSNGTPDEIERWDSTLQKWVLKDDFEWGEQGPCGGEYEMWIGENGDTIWE
tara:strand:- start:832 stop:1248 length:417 start_codon:yes stop_codon:yes gene_type:complete